MLYAWLLTLPAAGLVGGLAALLADLGNAGVVILLVLLAVASALIFAFSRRHKVDRKNVTDSAEVMVFAAARSYGSSHNHVEPSSEGHETRHRDHKPTTRSGV
jgi:PiT family inorganic phosphate transporter